MTSRAVVGLLHPGEMGAAIAAELARTGLTVLWASTGRSQASRIRAESAGLADVRTPAAMAREAEIILSVCPPAAAAQTAESVVGFRGTYVEANALAPQTTCSIEAATRAAGAGFVDAGIVGRPPRAVGDTRLYLSGQDAEGIAALFDATLVEAIVLGERVGAASALKVAYAAWTKGSSALLLAAAAYAESEGLGPALLGEWRRSLPQLEAQHASAREAAAAKGWRWVGEMDEIALALAASGLPDGFHRGAAEVFARCMAEPPDAPS